MSANGRLTRSELTLVQSNNSQYLSVKTARAYKRARKALQKHFPSADKLIASPAGAYRSFFVQGDMHVHPGLYNINPKMTVNLASAGLSTHGLGTAFDLVGVPNTDSVRGILRQYGFSRPFGVSDPNHFQHDGKTAVNLITSGTTKITVHAGDTLSHIAAEYGTTVAKLVALNKIKNPDAISVGQTIRVR